MHIDAGQILSTLSHDLYEAGWDGSIEPYPGQPVWQFAMAHLHGSIVKKYLPGTSDKNPQGDAAALELFMKVNNSCRDWFLDQSSFTDLEAVALGEFRQEIDKFFFPDWNSLATNDTVKVSEDVSAFRGPILSLDRIVEGFGLGNGANIGASETDLYSKLATSSMAATSRDLHLHYVHAIRCNPTWTEMEHSRSTKMGYTLVKGSRLSFVPKTAKISRTICTEPILNMLYQKGIAHCLERRLRQVYGIDLSSQPRVNAEYARIGSLTGRFGTIDLSSASDSISMAFCKEFLPRQVMHLLELARSPSTTLPGGKEIDLHMISSMGNAYTFPLQTMIFCAIVCACYKAYGIHPMCPRGDGKDGNFSVFGDDIIVLARAYKLVCRMLTVLGFTVNADKSFDEGQFRESCGSDFYAGHNVRGVYIKRLRDVSDCYSAINRLIRWSARHGIRLRYTIALLQSKVRYLPIPYDEMDDAGIKVPEDMLLDRRLHSDTRATMYRYSHLTSRTISLKQYQKGCKLKGFFVNEAGLLVAFLAGSIRNGSIVLRSNRRKAVIRKRYSSRWDYIPNAWQETATYAADWKAAAWACLQVPGGPTS